MVRQTNTASQDIRQICVEKFQEWWDVDELKDTLRFMTSQSVFDLLKNGKKDSENFLDNKQNVAELLFDSVGPRFLHKVLTEDNQEHKGRTKQFWVKIFETTIKKKFVCEKTVFDIFKKFGGMDITNLSEIENTILDILGGIRSTCTYVGANQLKHLSKRTTFIRVTQQLNEVYGKE